jgi:N-methylhydantoinase B
VGSNLIRASFSTNIRERRDCSVGLFDAEGRLIAQAAHTPLHLGSLLGAVEAVRREFPFAEMAGATPSSATTPISQPAPTCRTSRS